MILEAFGYPPKAKKADSQLIQSIVALKRHEDGDVKEAAKEDDSKPSPGMYYV